MRHCAAYAGETAPLTEPAREGNAARKPVDWMRDEMICCLSVRSSLLLANALATIFHSVFVVVTVVVGSRGSGGYSTPSVHPYLAELNFNPNSTESARFELVPYYVKQEWTLSLPWLTTAFFGLSAFFHGAVVVLSLLGDVYYEWLSDCQQPLRYAALVARRGASCAPRVSTPLSFRFVC